MIDRSEIVCPTCATVIGERCPATWGHWQCQATGGHRGWHWVDVGAITEILIWTGVYCRRNCPERLGENDDWCIKTEPHDRHTNGRGTTWVLDEEMVVG